MGGAKFCRFALFPLMLLMLLLLPAGMVAQTEASSSKYIATYESSTQTLTFKENVGETLPENSAWVIDGTTVGAINEKLGNGTIVHIVFHKSFSTYTPTSLYRFFKDLTKLETITGLEYLNTEKVTDMSYMFFACSKLTSLDVTNFNTENVKNMVRMFYNCSTLTSLDVTKFNTGNVTNMRYMFCACSALTSLDVTKFNTGNVTDMGYMFYNCSKLTSLDVTKFNTAKVTDMSNMFVNCSKLTSLDVTKFNTGNVTDMGYMFYNCSALTSLDVTNFNTMNVTNMRFMFYGCSSLTSLDVTKFNTEKVTNMNRMFYNCSKLTSLDVTNFNTENVTNMSYMFSSCSALTTIYASDKFVMAKAYKESVDMFKDCTNLKGAITEYDESKTDYHFANYKTGYFTKLVGKNGDEKIGAVGETLAADTLTLADGKDFVAYEPFAAKAASYSRTMKEGTTWATLCLPFEVSLANQNFRAFKLLSADEGTETVELEEIETSIAAGTPVIIKMKDGATKLNFTVANKEIANEVKTAETANGNYQFQGLYTQKVFSKDADDNCYIVKGEKLMNPAKLLEKTTTESVGSKPFRAYMVDKSSAPVAGARMFSIRIGDGTTAIKQLEADAADAADGKAEYYDLQGHRLQDLQKGVNIVKRGGKTMKVVIK